MRGILELQWYFKGKEFWSVENRYFRGETGEIDIEKWIVDWVWLVEVKFEEFVLRFCDGKVFEFYDENLGNVVEVDWFYKWGFDSVVVKAFDCLSVLAVEMSGKWDLL